MPDQISVDKVEKKAEKAIEKAAEDMAVDLPNVKVSIVLKLVSLFILVGGLSIIGSSFADVFNKDKISFGSYLLRLSSGIGSLFVSYGIIKKKRWSIILYSGIVVVAALINVAFSIFPALIALVLLSRWKDFQPESVKIYAGFPSFRSGLAKLSEQFYQFKNKWLSRK